MLAEIGSDLTVKDVIEQIRALDEPETDSPYTPFQRTLVLGDTSARCRFDETFLRFARRAREEGASKAEYVEAFRLLLGEFRHVETGRNLDERM